MTAHKIISFHTTAIRLHSLVPVSTHRLSMSSIQREREKLLSRSVGTPPSPMSKLSDSLRSGISYVGGGVMEGLSRTRTLSLEAVSTPTVVMLNLHTYTWHTLSPLKLPSLPTMIWNNGSAAVLLIK